MGDDKGTVIRLMGCPLCYICESNMYKEIEPEFFDVTMTS